MTDEEIIKKAITQASERGWEEGKSHKILMENFEIPKTMIVSIIFDHDFAKAFWGELPGDFYIHKNSLSWHFNSIGKIKRYEYYLFKLALSEDRTKYLEQFLDK